MVSESVSWPVRMMIGALKPFLRRMRTASRPSMDQAADIKFASQRSGGEVAVMPERRNPPPPRLFIVEL